MEHFKLVYKIADRHFNVSCYNLQVHTTSTEIQICCNYDTTIFTESLENTVVLLKS